jgi:glutamate synthase (NADPH/NADH)
MSDRVGTPMDGLEWDWHPQAQGLYDPCQEKDNCGVGMIADMTGRASRRTVADAMSVLDNLDHRGARGCEQNTGDGAGIMCSMPDKFLRRVFHDDMDVCSTSADPVQLKLKLPPPRKYAVGNVFFSKNPRHFHDAMRIVHEYATSMEGLNILGWRSVPTCSTGLGATAKSFEPKILQVVIAAEGDCYSDERLFEAKLFMLRRVASKAVQKRLKVMAYFCSLSARVINYKGMLTCGQLSTYFPDLHAADFEAHIAIVHSRFSTNTFPSWQRAHPYRYIAHNGEINTIRGNTNWMKAREEHIASDLIPNLDEAFPLFNDDQTDSSQLDNILEVMTLCGRSLVEVAVMMVPQAWEKTADVSPALRDYCKANASVMEPWDGPALICFTDGNTAGACLDRNGLRPCRYYITKDQRFICASEAGVLPALDPRDVARKGRLQPGRIISVDFDEHKIFFDAEIKQKLAEAKPYGSWIEKEGITLDDLHRHARKPARRFSWKGSPGDFKVAGRGRTASDAEMFREGDPGDQGLRAFGFTQEVLEMILKPMAEDASEALGSMGNDTPLACLSDLPRPVFDYFYQRFAQVSNPPIDPIRETVVMSLSAWIGPEQNLLAPLSPAHCRRLWLEQPCLLPADMDAIYAMSGFRGWSTHAIDATFPVDEGLSGMYRHLIRVCHEACGAIRFGECKILVLSDRAVSRERAPLPSLLCAGAVHQALVREKIRLRAGIVVDSGEPREVAQMCLLFTFGVDAVCPYNAYEAILKLVTDGHIAGRDQRDARQELELFKNFQKAIGTGILKVMAKMGVSTLQSYKGAQIAEPIGLNDDITALCFSGSVSQVSGKSFSDIAEDVLRLHCRGYPPTVRAIDQLSTALIDDGKYNYRHLAGSELHLNEPMLIAQLQEAARKNSKKAYESFASIHNGLVKRSCLRGQLEFRKPREYEREEVPLDEVEPTAEILKRFRTGAMSYGSISMEAHATLAVAMNRIQGLSNTGEGGEDNSRFEPMENGDSANSGIKQVASGRFGVTMEYLSSAKELQIKMAQGAKPGEGGELPGWKVEPHIAKCRNSTPGVGLVSPPPHHDIYSIEDLAQLIHDLKSANPKANVSVKLVSELGVGVVAAGVAKALADHILVSGSDGGTGASKWTGIKSAGAPWELGLSETHQTLVLNGLRGRVSLETDGNLRTGRDVLLAALLGAEHFGFATAPLIAMGCIMMRKCHLNTCPVGIASQDPVLRQKFEGLPEHVTNYLLLVAEDIRGLMASLGFRTMAELIGRADVLTIDSSQFRTKPLVLTKLLTPAHWLPDAGKIGEIERSKVSAQDRSSVYGGVTGDLIAACRQTIESGTPITHDYGGVRNLDRTIGTMLSHELCKAWGNSLAAGACHITFTGTCGQSFGAFACKGLHLELEGDSQDYFGKGLSGGMLAVYPSKASVESGFVPSDNVITGNAALYGATGGVACVRGICAERFAVRNSGAWAVVEGTGDHCCEYMTGGRVAVLGVTGGNFASGMSGGVAWVWDPKGVLATQLSPGDVETTRMEATSRHAAYPTDVDDLKELLEAHVLFTGSSVAKQILEQWPLCLPEFVRVFPTDYKRALAKSDLGRSDVEAFRKWIPGVQQTPSKAAKEIPPKGTFKLKSVDIEDIGGGTVKGYRPKVDEPAKLSRNGGFIKYDSAAMSKRSIRERAADFMEVFASGPSEDRIQTQASRCMDCGTPFCHQSVTNRSGCPLGNLIPEWNALVREGDWKQAFERLRQTNNFPEFTGRVCPAPCQASCTLGIIDDPVEIKSVELRIIDHAYDMGWMVPVLPPIRTGKKVAIVGSGPCGLAAADELNRRGHTVSVFERSDRPGGLMMYGVPNMKADKVDVVQRRADIMQDEGVTFYLGSRGNVGQPGGPQCEALIDDHDALLLASGATLARDMTSVPGRQHRGVHLAMDYLHGNTKALLDGGKVGTSWRQTWGKKADTLHLPIDAKGKRVVVIGGGDTGNDCIGTAVRQGAKSIVNLELLPKPPPQRSPNTPWPHWPSMQLTDYGHEEAAEIVNDGKDIRQYSVSTKEFLGDASGAVTGLRVVSLEWSKDMKMSEVPGSERVIEADLVFLALGFLGTESSIADSLALKLERGNYQAPFKRGAGGFKTSTHKVFAAGDCRRGQSLVVWAIREGRDAAEAIHQEIMG